MSQFEVIFGKEIVEQFSLSSDTQLIAKVEELLGKENYDELRKDFNSEARYKKTKYDFTNWQNTILLSYFEKELGNIDTQEKAEQFLKKLKEMDKVRIRVKGDNFFSNYYESKCQLLKNQFPGLNEELCRYEPCKFYPTIYLEEKIQKLDERILYDIGIPENIAEFNSINLEKYKRYRAIVGENIIELVTCDRKITSCNFIDDKGSIIELFWGSFLKQKNIKFADMFSVKNGKIYINPIFLGDGTNDFQTEMLEIPLGITKKDIYAIMLKREEENIRTESIFEKIKRKIKGTKRLPQCMPMEKSKNNEWKKNIRVTQQSSLINGNTSKSPTLHTRDDGNESHIR